MLSVFKQFVLEIFKSFIGPLNTDTVEELEEGLAITNVYEHCRQFYIEAIQQIKKRFVFDDSFFEVAQLVQPRYARANNPPHLRQLFQRFPELKQSCNYSMAEIEWRAISLIPLDDIGILGCPI